VDELCGELQHAEGKYQPMWPIDLQILSRCCEIFAFTPIDDGPITSLPWLEFRPVELTRCGCKEPLVED
jgi:hypothetical protein